MTQKAEIAILRLDEGSDALGQRGREHGRAPSWGKKLAEPPQPELSAQPQPNAFPPELPALLSPSPTQPVRILDPNAPLDNAREFARHELYRDGSPEVWFWSGQFWRWNGQYYTPFSEDEMRGQVYQFLDSAYVWEGADRYGKFKPAKRHVDGLLDALRSCLALSSEYVPPMWIDNAEPATDWVVFRNGIVNVVTSEVHPLTHRLWAQSGLMFDWNAEAECPTWVRFCNELFPDDQQSFMFLEEFMGYCMTGDTKFEKAAMLIGPRRSGKSTIVDLIGKLVGEGAYVGLSFNDWLASAKATQVLIGKRVVAFPDVRLKPAKMFGRTLDAGGIDHRSSELLLKITGRDKISIGQMYEQAWNGVLQAKIILTSNEVPNFNDTSGVLPTRFIKLHFRQSFAGREDVNLRNKLTAELPGIAQYCLGAYERLCTRGHFVQPASSAELEEAVLAASDPFTAMALECFAPDAAEMVSKAIAYARFERWCEERGQFALKLGIKQNRIGARLREVAGFENINGEHRPTDPHTGKQGPRVWLGMRLRQKGT